MQYRDLTIIPMNTEEHIVIACDGCAGVGEKEHDVLKAPPEVVGAYCVRVPLLEILSFGAEILSIVQVVGNEFEPTARLMKAGIQEELKKAGLAMVAQTGSTEENMQTTTTSIAVTIIGRVKAGMYTLGAVPEGARAFRVGEPLVGEDVLMREDEMVTYQEIHKLRNLPGIIEIVPLGSRGTRFECEEIARCSQLKFQVHCDAVTAKTLSKSGGPATAVIAVVEAGQVQVFRQAFPKSVYIGDFEKS